MHHTVLHREQSAKIRTLYTGTCNKGWGAGGSPPTNKGWCPSLQFLKCIVLCNGKKIDVWYSPHWGGRIQSRQLVEHLHLREKEVYLSKTSSVVPMRNPLCLLEGIWTWWGYCITTHVHPPTHLIPYKAFKQQHYQIWAWLSITAQTMSWEGSIYPV